MGQNHAVIKILCWENRGKFQALIVLFQREGEVENVHITHPGFGQHTLTFLCKKSAFSLAKSRLALGSPGCLVGCHHAKDGVVWSAPM